MPRYWFGIESNSIAHALADLIIPQTDTPGAKAALVNRHLDLRYSEEPPAELISVLAWIDGRSLSKREKPFVRLTQEQQVAMLQALADPANSNPEDRAGVEFFQLIEELTIFGYYTSEISLEKEPRYGGDTFHTSFPEPVRIPNIDLDRKAAARL